VLFCGFEQPTTAEIKAYLTSSDKFPPKRHNLSINPGWTFTFSSLFQNEISSYKGRSLSQREEPILEVEGSSN
jgi:hypothetical protein